MTRTEKSLAVLLRLIGAVSLLALGAVVMPHSWMAAIHRWLGVAGGELPDTPVIGYLTRSLSAMYAFHGALLVFLSLDVRRYLPVIRLLAVLFLSCGAALLAIDRAVGLPAAWVLGEGPFIILMGVVMLWLATRSVEQPVSQVSASAR